MKIMRFKNFVLGVGIFVVYALVLWQGIQAFYPAPEYGDFCDEFGRAKPVPIGGDVDCVESEGLRKMEESCWDAGGDFRYEYGDDGCPVGGTCDECRIEYEEARDGYSGIIFFISLIAGIITFILGFSFLKVEPVGSALLASGVWALFYGTVWNWRNFSNIIRFVLLLLVLIILIWIAVRLNTRGYLFKKRRK